MNAQELIFRLVTILVPLILAISVHEWAHVAMARFLGDDLGTREGRFTLNPLAHIDPVWTIALPAMLIVISSTALPFFAAGKPAPYNPGALDRKFGGKRITLRTAELLVAAAGPASNIVLALLSVGIIAIMYRAGADPSDSRSVLYLMVQFFLLNIVLAVFNLIPIPPLDGSKVLMSVLPRDLAARYESFAGAASWFLLILLIMGPIHFILSPFQNAGLWFLNLVAF